MFLFENQLVFIHSIVALKEVMMENKIKAEKRKWTEEEVENLIDQYEAEPCLWDIFCNHYSKRDVKEKTISEIAENIGVTVAEIKQKWTSLRAQFGRELKNSTKHKSGQSTDELYVSQWVFYEKMHFLQNVMKTKKSRDSLDLVYDSPVRFSFDDEEGEDLQDPNIFIKSTKKCVRKMSKLEDTKQQMLTTCIDVLKKKGPQETNTNKEVCHFSMRVADKLKSFNKIKRMIAEKRINDILFEIVMEE